MILFGNLCAGLLGLWAIVMFRFVSNPVSRSDYIAAILFSIILLPMLFGLFSAVVWTGKLDFLGWPRFLQYGGVVIACLSLTVLTGMSAAVHGSGGSEFPWSIRPFCPWAAYAIPVALALIGALWLNAAKLAFPEFPLRLAFGAATAIALLSNIGLAVEVQRNQQQQADAHARESLQLVQQTDADKEFGRLLHHTSEPV